MNNFLKKKGKIADQKVINLRRRRLSQGLGQFPPCFSTELSTDFVDKVTSASHNSHFSGLSYQCPVLWSDVPITMIYWLEVSEAGAVPSSWLSRQLNVEVFVIMPLP
jgi:hypothetical protein